MTEFDINEALSQEELEARAHEGDIAACFVLINEIDQRDGANRQEWVDCVEARFGEADAWEFAGDLAIAFETLGGVIPGEWMDDAKGSRWLLSPDGIAALAAMREALQPEPSVSADGVWSVRENDDLLNAIAESGYWVALQQFAPASSGQKFRAASESTLLDTAVEFPTLWPIPWPLVIERARAGDLTAIVLLCDHLTTASEDPDDEFTDVEEHCLDNDPYSAWTAIVEYLDPSLDDNRLAAVADAFEKNGQLLPVSWGDGPEVCHLLNEAGERAVDYELQRSFWRALLDEYGVLDGAQDWYTGRAWDAFFPQGGSALALERGVSISDARLGPLEGLIEDYLWSEFVPIQDPEND